MKNNTPKIDPKSWYTMLADSEHVDIYIYGVIGWDIDTSSFIQAMSGYSNAKTITVYLSTIGGCFADGLVIFNTLKQHPAEKTVVVMGFALSWGSLMMLVAAKGKLQAANNAMFMIHKPQGAAYGDANEMRKEAAVLDMLEASVIPEYQQRLKLSKAEMEAVMAAETWYTAESALAAGLIDEIIDPIDVSGFENVASNNMLFKHTLSAYRHPPEQVLQLFEPKRKKNGLLSMLGLLKPQDPAPETQPPENEIDMTPEELKALLAENSATLLADIESKIDAKLEAKLAGLTKSAEPPPPAKDELTLLKEQVATLQAENAELKTPADPTKVPLSSGAADDNQDNWV